MSQQILFPPRSETLLIRSVAGKKPLISISNEEGSAILTALPKPPAGILRKLLRAGKTVRWRLQEAAQEHLGAIATLLLHPLAGKCRRRPDLWLFGHQDDDFAGNPKFLYLWMLEQRQLEVVWITGSWRLARSLRARGWPAELRWSPRGIALCLRAGAAFFAHRTSDINAALLNGAVLVNLWHGVGLKAIQLGWSPGRTSVARRSAQTRYGRARYRTYIEDPDIVVTTSDFMQAHFASQFQLDAERCPQLGYPRVDCALNPQLALSARRFDDTSDFALRADGALRAYIYMPTSRDSNRPLLASALPDLHQLERALAARGAILYLKLHPRTKEKIPPGLERIRAWPSGVDFQTYLHEFDALITDYSSVLYDYLAVRSSGAVVYAYDLAEYLRTDRSLLYPFVENTAGHRIGSFDALCQSIASGAAEAPVDPSELERIRRLFWGGPATESAPRIAAYVARRLTSGESAGGKHQDSRAQVRSAPL